MEAPPTIKEQGSDGEDRIFECYIEESLTRCIFFSAETQEDLDSEIHSQVIDSIIERLHSEPLGPDLRVIAKSRTLGMSASRRLFELVPIPV